MDYIIHYNTTYYPPHYAFCTYTGSYKKFVDFFMRPRR